MTAPARAVCDRKTAHDTHYPCPGRWTDAATPRKSRRSSAEGVGVDVDVDVYRVGFLRDLHHARIPGRRRSPWRWIRLSWRDRDYWNGWLAEHEGHPHNAGRGWTRRAARRRADRLCRAVSQ